MSISIIYDFIYTSGSKLSDEIPQLYTTFYLYNILKYDDEEYNVIKKILIIIIYKKQLLLSIPFNKMSKNVHIKKVNN